MKLHEYQSKLIFSRLGIPIPNGKVAISAREARQIAEELGKRVVVKAQVLVSGRGKAGGIKLAKTPQEAETMASQILGMTLKNLHVRKLLIDEAVNISKEYYLGITVDRALRVPVILACSAGGADIEDVSRTDPQKIIKVSINPLLGLQDFQARELAIGIDLPHEHWRLFTEIAQGLWKAFSGNDATMAEINPLVISTENTLLAVDAKMVIDDNALYRHPELIEMREFNEETSLEIEAQKFGLSYVSLEGNIGCMVNGAGLAMATIDSIKISGGEPANFLDIGGGANSEKVTSALHIILTDTKVKGILINIFGGITRCDEVASGLLSFLNERKVDLPIVVRLAGTNSDLAHAMLAEASIESADSLQNACQQIVAAVKGGEK